MLMGRSLLRESPPDVARISPAGRIGASVHAPGDADPAPRARRGFAVEPVRQQVLGRHEDQDQDHQPGEDLVPDPDRPGPRLEALRVVGQGVFRLAEEPVEVGFREQREL